VKQEVHLGITSNGNDVKENRKKWLQIKKGKLTFIYMNQNRKQQKSHSD
jgi:hypothetical protein